jgi:hypothetical protein
MNEARHLLKVKLMSEQHMKAEKDRSQIRK